MSENTFPSVQHEQLRAQLLQLEAALCDAGLWSALPPSEEAMASTMPFMFDTLQIEAWLQWVFVPRLHALIDGDLPLPGACSVQPLAEHQWNERALTQHEAALRVLEQIDATLSGQVVG